MKQLVTCTLLFCLLTGVRAAQPQIGNIVLPDPTLQPLLTVKPGDDLDYDQVAQSIRNLFKTGFFSDVQVYEEAGENGTVDLEFVTIPQIRFGKVTFSGDLGLKQKRIRKFMTESYPEGEPFHNDRYMSFIQSLRGFYEEMGYPDVQLDHYVDFSSSGERALPRISVQTGPPLLIRSITCNLKDVSDEVKLDSGERLDRKQMDHDMTDIMNVLRKKGFYNASAGYRVEITDRQADVTVTIDRGEQIQFTLENVDLTAEDETDILSVLKRDGVTDTSVNITRNNLYFRLLEKGYWNPDIRVVREEARIRFVVEKPVWYEVQKLSVDSPLKLGVEQPAFYNRLSMSDLRSAVIEQLKPKGYLAPEVKFDYDATSRKLSLTVNPGTQRTIGPITVRGETEYMPELPGVETGKVFNPHGIVQAVQKGEQELLEADFYNPKILLQQDPVTDNAIPLTFTILTEGRRNVSAFFIHGNEKVSTDFVRNLLTLTPGDPVTRADIERMKNRLEGTGLFSTVEVTPFHIAQDSVSVFVNLTERPLTTFRYGVGFNSDEGARGSVQVNRAYLFGRELTGTFLTRISPKRQQLYLNVSGRSHFMGSVFGFLEDKDDYRFSRLGISVSYNTTVGLYTGMILSLEAKRNRLTNVTVPLEEIEKELHPVNTVSFNGQLLYDRRNDLLYPTEGYYLSLRMEPTYDTTGGRFYLKYLEKFSMFFNRLSFSQTFGHIVAPRSGYTVPLPDRFFSGGTNTLRISSFEQAGPLFSNGAPRGGRVLALFNAEYRFPITEDLEGVCFLDIGNVWDQMSDVSFATTIKDIGTGVRFRTPLGPVRVELAYNLDQDTFPSRWKLQVSIGNTF